MTVHVKKRLHPPHKAPRMGMVVVGVVRAVMGMVVVMLAAVVMVVLIAAWRPETGD
jgi:cell division septal protein FtsQ